MILFLILILTLFFIIMFSVFVISITGAVGIVLLSDIIICGYLIIKFMTWLARRKKR